MAFDPDKYLASKAAATAPAAASSGGFDPDAYLASKGASDESAPVDRGVADAALRHGVKGLTLGFDDELGGGIGALADKIGGSSTPLMDLYTKHRDDLRKKAEEARTAHPWVSGAANVLGSIPTLAATGGTGGLLEAGAVGGAMGLGNSDADLTKGQYGKAAADTAIGAGIGAAANKVMGALAPDSLKNKANELAARAMKGSAGQYSELGDEGVQNLGRWALDSKAVKFGDNAHDILANVQGIKGAAGERIGQSLNDEGIAFGGKELADQAAEKVLPGIEDGTILNPQVNAAKGAISNLAEKGPMDFQQLQAIKSNLGKAAYNPLGGVEKEGLVPVERFLNEQLESAVDASGNSLPEFQAAKGDYKNAIRAETLAQKGASRGFSNQGFSLGDKVSALGGGAAFGPKGLLIGAANKLTRERGAASAAVGLDKLSQILTAAPEMFGSFAPMLQQAAQRGPQALAVQHFVLSQRDPQYQQLMNDVSGQSDK